MFEGLALAAGGFMLSAFVGIVLSIASLFFKDIRLFESIATSFIVVTLYQVRNDLSTWAALGIGVAITLVLYAVQNTNIGFWVVGGLFSVLWGYLIASMVTGLGEGRPFSYPIMVIVTIAIMGLHLVARRNHEASM